MLSVRLATIRRTSVTIGPAQLTLLAVTLSDIGHRRAPTTRTTYRRVPNYP